MTDRSTSAILAATACTALFAIAVGPSPAIASDRAKTSNGLDAANESDPVLHGHRDCPALLGDRRSRAANRRLRLDKVHWIERDDALDVTLVVHESTTWHRPRPLQLEGIEFVEPSADNDDAAIIELSESLAQRLDCPAGHYEVHIDDAIGKFGLLHVFDDGLLLVHGGKLSFLAGPQSHRTRWMMVWGSSWEIARARSARSRPRQRHHARKRRGKRH